MFGTFFQASNKQIQDHHDSEETAPSLLRKQVLGATISNLSDYERSLDPGTGLEGWYSFCSFPGEYFLSAYNLGKTFFLHPVT